MTIVSDSVIGESVARLRAAADMPQAELAARVRRGGHRWSQATVWSVEKGERPLRLSEAVLLAEILEFDLEQLYDQKSVELWAAENLVDDAKERYEKARRDYEQARQSLALLEGEPK